jgi:hypothetical protein
MALPRRQPEGNIREGLGPTKPPSDRSSLAAKMMWFRGGRRARPAFSRGECQGEARPLSIPCPTVPPGQAVIETQGETADDLAGVSAFDWH